MEMFYRFHKNIMRFIFSLPPRISRATPATSVPRQQSRGGRSDAPRTSCSSSSHYYSSNSHYSEAIADCIEFFNRSSQDGFLYARKSDVVV
ncbi:hypothetical protein Nepgr_019855 [Nepenthes gracilis]|uniref:Uncharacterized protein n=1 Tax=Nepenthes gracilis TaxID=150966 RepID=A0AAD3XVG4_NEPGR|nr:hypothetical protein Nepgr_019855 [Nepenthes gracilis]